MFSMFFNFRGGWTGVGRGGSAAGTWVISFRIFSGLPHLHIPNFRQHSKCKTFCYKYFPNGGGGRFSKWVLAVPNGEFANHFLFFTGRFY